MLTLRIKTWTLCAALTLCTLLTFAQDITVRVQVNRLPDGHYPTKVYQFSNAPGLVVLTLTNHTNATRTVYLTGKLTGDNGVLVATAKNYQPPVNIELGPFATKTLNAIEASYLFDINNLVYLSGNTSIKSSVFGEQGLPEGAYQVCIRAIDAATRQPLSDEEPIGCSNIFMVSTLEPPMILNPYNEQALTPTPVQAIPIRWTTPPGAPPSTEYRVRIVEVFGQRNPYDAILSSPTPFFETIVKGSPLFLYTVQQPQLQEGRTYAMIVVASDPMGGGTFRNNGQSEVVQFTYGGPNSPVTDNPRQPPAKGPTLEYANHTLSGRLSWAFKKTELGSHSIFSGNGVKQVASSSYLAANVSTGKFAMQAAVTPLVSLNALAAVNSDPTLLKTTVTDINKTISAANPPPQPVLPTGILSGSGSTSTDCSYETIAVDTATERFALAGVSVTLRAVTTAGSQSVLLATGQTDADGNFSLQFLDPAYGANSQATRLILSAGTVDFENTELPVPLSVLDHPNADIGNHLLLAKTMRLFPKIIFDSLLADNNNGYGFHIYREIGDLQDRPWLANEGQIGNSKRSPVNVDGRQLIEIAADSIAPTGSAPTSGKLALIHEVLEAKGAGRIFFGGNLYVTFTPSSDNYNERASVVSILNAPIPANKVLQGTVLYHLSRKPSQVSGNVYFGMGEQGRIPIQGAIIRLTYKKTDRAPGVDPNSLFSTTATATDNKPVVKWTDQEVKDPGQTTLQIMAWGIAPDKGLYTPVMIEPAITGKSGLAAKAVLDPVAAVVDLNPVPDSMNAITTTADELGDYHIMLPPLKKNAIVTVEVIKTPADFRNFIIEAQGTKTSKATWTTEQGASKRVDFAIKGDVADVVGRVVNDKGLPLAHAHIEFNGATLAETGPDGIFEFRIYPGSHVLSLEKEGYVVKQVTISVPQLTNNKDNGYASQWLKLDPAQKQAQTLTRISQSQTVQASVSRGNAFSPAMFGIAATLSINPLAVAFGVSTSSPGSQYETPREFALDLKDIGYLNKIVGKARFRILEDGTNNPIAGVRINVFDSTHTTDDKGEWYYEGFGGNATLTLLPPAGTQYIAEQRLITLVETGQEQLITVALKKGIAISGTVSSGNKPLPNARILLDGNDFTGILTDALGHYTLFTTPGPHDVGARKQGYVGSDAKTGDNKPVDFILIGGNTHNYFTLLGFDIELDAASPVGGPGTTQEKWSGNFVHLSPIDKSVFTMAPDMRIPFTDLIVSFDTKGNPLPANNIVKTDLTELPLKLFGYLPVKLTGTDVVTFTGENGAGQLNGKISVAFNSIQGYRGWSLNDNNVTLAKTGATAAGQITLLSSAGNQPADQSFSLTGGSGTTINGLLYGFNISLKTGTVDKDGIQFTGSIATPASGPIKSINVDINNFSVNRALSVSATLLKQDNLPVLEIATWKATIGALIFNEDGFKIGGSMALDIPRSGISQIAFSDLSIAKTGLFGGKFDIPDKGINILTLADLNSNRSPLTFGQVGSSSVYRLSGKASLKVNVEILKVPLDLPAFEIMTNGDFSLQAPSDYHTNVGPFGFAMTNLIINAKANTPSIVIQGQFKADLDFIKFEVGDISILPAGGGPVFSVSKVGVKLDVSVVKTTVLVSFDKDGFSGDGSLEIPACPIKGDIGFRYFKRADGIELGAKFFANTPPIPLGGSGVTLNGIGGGFNYKAGGTNGGFSVDVMAKLSYVGAAVVAALDPLTIHVESVGVLSGFGDMVMASYFKRGHVAVVYNGPDQTFTVQIDEEMSPLEGLAKETIQGALVISAKKGDEYVFLGVATHAKLLDLIDNHGEMAFAIGLKNPKTRGDMVAHYFEYAPDDYMRERFSGVYLNVSSHIGISRDDALEFDFFVVSAKAWFGYGYDANLLLNFEEGAYRISFGGGFSLGIEACVAKIACVGINASMCMHVEGGRNNTVGWNFQATASGDAGLSFGLGIGDCDPGCNEVTSFWDGCIGGAFKVCGNASVDLSFTEQTGLKFKARAGGTTSPCF